MNKQGWTVPLLEDAIRDFEKLAVHHEVSAADFRKSIQECETLLEAMRANA